MMSVRKSNNDGNDTSNTGCSNIDDLTRRRRLPTVHPLSSDITNDRLQRHGLLLRNRLPGWMWKTQSSNDIAAALASSVTVPTVSNVDEALGGFAVAVAKIHVDFRTGIIQEKEDGKISSSSPPHPATFDWILDGYPEWNLQYQKTSDLMEQLYPSESTSGCDRSNHPTHQRLFDEDPSEILLQLGSPMGTQEYQFAHFDGEDQVNEGIIEKETDTNEAQDTTSSTNNNHNFSQFWKTAVTAPTPQHTFDMESSSTYASHHHDDNDKDNDGMAMIDPIDQFLLEKMATAALGTTHNTINCNPDDDDDFGDFQQAEAKTEASNASETNDDNQETAIRTIDSPTISDNTKQNLDNEKDVDNHQTHKPVPTNTDTLADDSLTDGSCVDTDPKSQQTQQNDHIHDKNKDKAPLPPPPPTEESCVETKCQQEPMEKDRKPSPLAAVKTDLPTTSPTHSQSHSPSNNDYPNENIQTTTIDTSSPPPKSAHDQRYQCTATDSTKNTITLAEPPTPVTRNYYPSPAIVVNNQNFHQDDYDSEDTGSPSPRKCHFPKHNHDEERQDDDDDDEEESVLWTQTSQSQEGSTSIPKEVVTKTSKTTTTNTTTPAKEHKARIAIPQTVRISSMPSMSPYTFPSPYPTTTTATAASVTSLSSPSFSFGRNSTLAAVTAATSLFPVENDNDEPSISSSLASPEIKFLRRHNQQTPYSSESPIAADKRKRTQQRNDGDDDQDTDDFDDPRNRHCHHKDDSFDEEESVSLGSLGTLPENYLKHPDLDYTLRELNKLEWDWLPFWKMQRLLDNDYNEDGHVVCDTGTIPLLQDQITQRLSRLDAFYAKVCNKVYKKIQPHADELAVANQATLDLQKNLQLAQMYMTRTQEAIIRAKFGSTTTSTATKCPSDGSTCASHGGVRCNGLGVHGAIHLLDSWDKLAALQGLSSVVQTVSDIFDLEVHVLKRIKSFEVYRHDAFAECQAIVNLVEDLKQQSHGPTAARLKCLDEIRKRAEQHVSQTFLHHLHELLEEMVAQWSIAPIESQSVSAGLKAYERLMDAFQLVYNAKEQENKDSTAFSSAICTTIHTAFLLEIQKAFGRSLLCPTGEEQHDLEDCQYATELNALRYNEQFLDAARLPIWTHNLVTIRFDFEMKDGHKHPLPNVFHKLCWLLTNILFATKGMIEWQPAKGPGEDCPTDNLITMIRNELPKRRSSLWNACIQSLEGCVEEYLKFAGNKRLFVWAGETCDDSNWLQELEGLQDVIALNNQFLSLGSDFLKDVPTEFVNDGSLIREKLSVCCKRHVRTFHVAAMNSLGGMLYREDWKLLSPLSTDDTEDNVDAVAKAIIENIARHLFDSGKKGIGVITSRSTSNGFIKTDRGFQVSSDSRSNNPFDLSTLGEQCKGERPMSCDTPLIHPDWSDKHVQMILQTLVECLGEVNAPEPKAMTKSVLRGIIPWCARVFVLIDKLPAMSEQAVLVLTNIFDLYIITAFRITAGDASKERILLGLDDKSRRIKRSDVDAFVSSRFASQSFTFSRRSQQTQSNLSPLLRISPSLEAEMCSFVVQEEKSFNLSQLRELIVNGQHNLKDIAKLNLVDKWILDPVLQEDMDEDRFALLSSQILEKRCAASYNVVCLAAALQLSACHLSAFDSTLKSYQDAFVAAMPTFVSLTNRMNAMRSVCGRAIVSEIVSLESAWEESKLHEHPNDYVENLCDFFALMWQNLCCSPNRLPSGQLEHLYECMVGAGFMAILEGFSKVPFCSTEGRALMSMDVMTYSQDTSPVSIAERNGAPKVPRPKRNQPYRDMAYADAYIKMFYFPHKDVIAWIQDNYQRYHYPHMLALVLATASNANDARKALQILDSNYFGQNVVREAKQVRL